jgi:membrane-associated phospholipid phosphatase
VKIFTKKISILFLFTYISINAQRSDIEVSGDIIQLALPAAALTSTFIYPSTDKPHWQFVKTFLAANVLTQSLKYIINEQRPNGGNHSFPSGHTTAAFSGAAFLQIRYGWKVGIPAYLLAGYVGFTRVYARKHYIWDVMTGATIGIGSAMIFTKSLQNKNLSLNIGYSNGYQLSVKIRF